jgi:hypothetical protein
VSREEAASKAATARRTREQEGLTFELVQQARDAIRQGQPGRLTPEHWAAADLPGATDVELTTTRRWADYESWRDHQEQLAETWHSAYAQHFHAKPANYIDGKSGQVRLMDPATAARLSREEPGRYILAEGGYGRTDPLRSKRLIETYRESLGITPTQINEYQRSTAAADTFYRIAGMVDGLISSGNRGWINFVQVQLDKAHNQLYFFGLPHASDDIARMVDQIYKDARNPEFLASLKKGDGSPYRVEDLDAMFGIAGERGFLDVLEVALRLAYAKVFFGGVGHETSDTELQMIELDMGDIETSRGLLEGWRANVHHETLPKLLRLEQAVGPSITLGLAELYRHMNRPPQEATDNFRESVASALMPPDDRVEILNWSGTDWQRSYSGVPFVEPERPAQLTPDEFYIPLDPYYRMK